MAQSELGTARIKPVKRTKTFTGCWTCRTRGVKCDEGKPTCQRCAKAGWDCQGYGIRLVWLHENVSGTEPGGNGASQQECDLERKIVRRRLFDRPSQVTPSLSEEAVDSMLETLGTSGLTSPQYVGPFGVFRLATSTNDREADSDRLENTEDECMHVGYDEGKPSQARRIESYSTQPFDGRSIDEMKMYEADAEGTSQSILDLSLASTIFNSALQGNIEIAEFGNLSGRQSDLVLSRSSSHLGVISDASREEHQLSLSRNLDYLSLRREERELMHHWVSSLSRTMAPMDDINNPYRSIYIPLALGDSEYGSSPRGQFALRHTIYSLAAFNLAQRGIDTEKYQVIGIKHHQLGIRYLSTDLLAQGSSQIDFLLATIIIMFTIELVNARSGWRIHLQGGRKWLQATAAGLTRIRGRDAMTLYQMFLCGEALGFSHPTSDVEPSVNVIENSMDHIEDRVLGLTTISPDDDFYLDSIFGITRPIFEAIVHINKLASYRMPISATELEVVRFQIVLSNPLTYNFPRVTSGCEAITKHHAFIWYYACEIYFEHTLCRTPSCELQTLVRKSLVHLKAIETDEIISGGYGLLWPRFIIACEAEGDHLRWAVSDYFKKGKDLGIGNLTSALAIVQELWRRRDEEVDYGTSHISWRHVAADLQDDVLLL